MSLIERSQLLSSEFAHGQVADQVKVALGLALLHVPLLPDEVDPSKDGVVATAGAIAVLLAQNQHPQALQAFQTALKEYPDIPSLRTAYAAASESTAPATQPADPSQLAQTARLFARGSVSANAVPASTGSAGFDELAKNAVKARDAGNLNDAVSNYRAALQVRPNWEDGWWDLSLLYFSSERYPDAIDPLKHVVQLKPGFGTAWAMLGLSEVRDQGLQELPDPPGKSPGLGTSGKRRSDQNRSISFRRPSEPESRVRSIR